MMRQRALVGVFLWGPYRGVDLQRIGAIGSCATVSRGLDETHFTWLVVGGNAAIRVPTPFRPRSLTLAAMRGLGKGDTNNNWDTNNQACFVY